MIAKEEEGNIRQESLDIPGIHAIVYKTKGDYTGNVPVLLSADKQRIIGYPAPGDLKVNGGYTFPTQLEEGYLLDNRGIGFNTAFLSMTYEEYSALEKVPPLKELMEMIIDDDPFVEMCDCGQRNAYDDMISQLNEMIRNKALREKCRVVK